ncbi:MAG: hypothetical protein ACYDAB_14470 [bacterium]
MDLDGLNQISRESLNDFRIQSFGAGDAAGDVLTIVRSFDLTYYHDVEIEFADVVYLSCPTYFHSPSFRRATDAERAAVMRTVDLHEQDLVFCIDADAGTGERTFTIAARALGWRKRKVMYETRAAAGR